MPLNDGERQVAPNISGIRRDHVARYEWAAKQLGPLDKVVDVGCGIGYGAKILAQRALEVVAVERDAESIRFAQERYSDDGIKYRHSDAADLPAEPADVGVAFEIIEHLADPRAMLRALHASGCRTLFASVPNEKVFPFKGHKFHHRHYTRREFEDLLAGCGWQVVEWWGQLGAESEVGQRVEGRTIVVKAVRAAATVSCEPENEAPAHVAIVGLGPSRKEFFKVACHMGGSSAYCDEVWGINQIGDVLCCDRIFHMDDVAVQELRAAARPFSNIAAMTRWLKHHPGPIYTSVVREGYPGLVAYPLEAVINRTRDGNGGVPYFNSTAAYAIAYAIHIGVKRISLYGIDYTQPNAYAGEKGRACVEFWLGIAAARGIEVRVPNTSPLLDMCAEPEDRLYGYDGVTITFAKQPDGRLAVSMTPKDSLPTADEIEHRYDHSRHPNRLVEAQNERNAAE